MGQHENICMFQNNYSTDVKLVIDSRNSFSFLVKRSLLPYFPENRTESYMNFCSKRHNKAYFQRMFIFFPYNNLHWFMYKSTLNQIQSCHLPLEHHHNVPGSGSSKPWISHKISVNRQVTNIHQHSTPEMSTSFPYSLLAVHWQHSSLWFYPMNFLH